jgi:hypothetical protein
MNGAPARPAPAPSWRWCGSCTSSVTRTSSWSCELADALDPLRTTFLEVRERYVKTTDTGPVGYAEQASEVEPDADAATLRADAVDVVQRFFAALDR